MHTRLVCRAGPSEVDIQRLKQNAHGRHAKGTGIQSEGSERREK